MEGSRAAFLGAGRSGQPVSRSAWHQLVKGRAAKAMLSVYRNATIST
ncbi:hypothetical protein ACFFX0_18840 [Citricoccus parietis]|uniref:Uncharacterized protein n=1 Tax=Citricoccus parietis TaxID=592307 RepID=A0ABV5G2J3_9MICC